MMDKVVPPVETQREFLPPPRLQSVCSLSESDFGGSLVGSSLSPSSSIGSDDGAQFSPRLPNSLRIDGELPFDVVSSASDFVGHFLSHQCDRFRGQRIPSPFDSSTLPKISLPVYFERIHLYSQATPETVVCSVVLIRRVAQLTGVHITHHNCHRLLLTAIMVFAKFYDDAVDSTSRWARIAGVRKSELTNLEVDFLNRCQFDLRVTPQEFSDCVVELLAFHTSQIEQQCEGEGLCESNRGVRHHHGVTAFHALKRAPSRKRSYYYGNAATEKRSIKGLFHANHMHLNRFHSNDSAHGRPVACGTPSTIHLSSPGPSSPEGSDTAIPPPLIGRADGGRSVSLTRAPSLQHLTALLHGAFRISHHSQ